jgi:hypothetical protein
MFVGEPFLDQFAADVLPRLRGLVAGRVGGGTA